MALQKTFIFILSIKFTHNSNSTTFEAMASLKLQLYSSNINYTNSNCTVQLGANNVCISLTENAAITSFELFDVDDANNVTEYEQCFQQSAILKQKVNNNKIVFNTSKYLLVPNSKFNVSNISNYLATTYGDEDAKQNINCTDDSLLSKLSIQVIYRLNIELYEAVNKFCNNAKYVHASTTPINQLFASNEQTFEKLKIQFYKNSMLVMVVYNNQIKLAHTYTYNTAEDIIYYLLNIMQEFSLNVESTNVEVSGLIDINSQHFHLLQSLFYKLSLEGIYNQPLFTNEVPVSNAHYYTPFINAAL